MERTCCILNCDSRSSGSVFYLFPKTEIGLKKWLQCINNKYRCFNNFNVLSHKEIMTLSLCHKHYITLFTKDDIYNGIPSKDIENLGLADHDYVQSKKRKLLKDQGFTPNKTWPLREIQECLITGKHLDQEIVPEKTGKHSDHSYSKSQTLGEMEESITIIMIAGYTNGRKVSKSTEHTSEMVSFFDDLFL